MILFLHEILSNYGGKPFNSFCGQEEATRAKLEVYEY